MQVRYSPIRYSEPQLPPSKTTYNQTRMATPPRSSVGERQERPISSGRAQMPRRSTRGLVDLSQAPVSGPLGSSSPTLSNSQTLSPTHSQRSPNPSSRPTSSPAFPAKDFSRLLRPELYHPLPTTDIPAPLRPSSSPPQDLPTLLSTSRFRAAAVLAANLLTTATAPTDHPTIFALLYVRLASLTLCNATALAAQEVKAVEDLNSALYLDPLTSAHLVPWELRVLAVRLQGIGFNDPRRGVVGYFELARDARRALAALRKAIAEDPESGDATLVERQMWEERLVDLGVRVAGALVEMEDLEGAAMHLRTLGEGGVGWLWRGGRCCGCGWGMWRRRGGVWGGGRRRMGWCLRWGRWRMGSMRMRRRFGSSLLRGIGGMRCMRRIWLCACCTRGRLMRQNICLRICWTRGRASTRSLLT
ncbi:hypothetical protein VC83_01124 [Pseudogymnoascus destructans]|uniref:Uncharacterized protein n=1 Tax=Pseudogymnoascus destructans TaxID=655981 RepID=A0A177AKP1_9PEZI|nr:uncharacterized protein VC83_01124 [Pseudogymnoascus destructans]OAF62628.2 hypothetical protein VC83_01124 [Pseudogymnoascus destructans]